jgi:hypothetical protein
MEQPIDAVKNFARLNIGFAGTIEDEGLALQTAAGQIMDLAEALEERPRQSPQPAASEP